MSTIRGFKRTRFQREHFAFGYPTKFSQTQLPTLKDVYLHSLAVKDELKSNGTSQTAQSVVAAQVASDVEAVWVRASVPIISHKAVREKVIRCVLNKARQLSKFSSTRRCAEAIHAKDFDVLFDIATCRCDLVHGEKCYCSKSRKIPSLEIPFLLDQRGSRRMHIGGIDAQTTSTIRKKIRRCEAFDKQVSREKARMKSSQSVKRTLDNDDRDDDDDNNNDDDDDDNNSDNNGDNNNDNNNDSNSTSSSDEEQLLKCSSATSEQMRFSLPLLAAECDRYQVSNRAGAALVNAALRDLGLVTADDRYLLIDHSKLRRERLKHRQAISTEQQVMLQEHEITSFYFDGRIDLTLCLISNDDGSVKRSKCREDHYVILSEPGNQYINHVTPNSSKAKDVAKEIIDTYRSVNGNLKVIGCDGTVNNVGCHGGIIHTIEMTLQKTVHWFVCQLHGNELLLRRLFETVDGKSCGPSAFCGDIGKAVSKEVSSLPVVDFESVPGFVSEIHSDVVKLLSADQRYLYEICVAVQNAHVPASLARRNPGKLHHARWLTLANRLLRLYVSTTAPNQQLLRLISFILNMYAPCWFHIRTHQFAINGAMNVLYQVNLAAKLPKADFEVIKPVLQRNSYFAHPENILIAMLGDSNKKMRCFAVDQILKTRKCPQHCSKTVRSFSIPTINFAASDLCGLIDWKQEAVTEPPLTRDMSNESIVCCKRIPLQILQYPCHTQGVERTVQLVTQSAMNCIGETNRHGWILNVLQSRKQRPSFQSKKDA
jgi:hypothetical protein